jgi:hypothetical protein
LVLKYSGVIRDLLTVASTRERGPLRPKVHQAGAIISVRTFATIMTVASVIPSSSGHTVAIIGREIDTNVQNRVMIMDSTPAIKLERQG